MVVEEFFQKKVRYSEMQNLFLSILDLKTENFEKLQIFLEKNHQKIKVNVQVDRP